MGGFEEHLLTFVKNFLGAVGYPGVFVLMAIEGIGIPIPSEVTMPFSGFLSSPAGGNKFSLPVAIGMGALGELCGSVVAYFLGYYGGRAMLQRYGKFVFISTAELKKGESLFARHGDWIVFITRLLPAARSLIPLPAGAVRMPFWRFFAFSAFGSLMWCAALAYLGHQLGQHWSSVSGQLRQYEVVVLPAILIAVAIALYVRLSGREDDGEADERAVS